MAWLTAGQFAAKKARDVCMSVAQVLLCAFDSYRRANASEPVNAVVNQLDADNE